MKNSVLATLFLASGVLFAADGKAEKDIVDGKIIWPADYQLEISKPETELQQAKPYLASVVQNLISDELSLQRRAVTNGKVLPVSLEYPVRADHESLPANERHDLLARFPTPVILPLKISRSDVVAAAFNCAQQKPQRYTIVSRVGGQANRLKVDILLCQGAETLFTSTTDTDEQELVAAIHRLVNPVRAKLTGDQYASLKITTAPVRASIYLDGQFLGKTPLHYAYLIPDNYKLTVKLDGYIAAEEAIVAKSGETFSSNYALQRARAIGTIDIDSQPAGAKIYLDADFKGVTPKKLENIPAGTYRVHVVKPEQGEIYRSVTISESDPHAHVSGMLSEFAWQHNPGLFGLPYKTWYWISLTGAAASFGTAIFFYVWRDQAKEDIYARVGATPSSQFSQADTDFVAERNAAYSARDSAATGFMVGAGVLAVASIYFYVQHLLSADEGIVKLEKPKEQGDVDIKIGGFLGQPVVSASFRF